MDARDQRCAGSKTGRRLPGTAYIDADQVLKALADKDRLENARVYWRERFGSLGEKFLIDGALSNRGVASFSRGVERMDGNSPVHRLLEGVFDLPAADPVFAGLVRRALCLVSLEEAAQAIADGAHEPDMIGAILAVYGNGKLPADDRDRLLGARGVRELFDLVRRFRLAGAVGASVGIPRSAVFACWRQEGSFFLAPPRTSWDHAPLVDTAPGTCRTPCLSFSGDGRRDGFVLSLDKPPGLFAGFEWPMTRASLLTLGGLDQIVVPLLSEQDELWVLLKAAAKRGQFLRLGTAFGDEAQPAQQAFAASQPEDGIAADIEGATDAVKLRAGARVLFETIAGLASLQLERGMDADIAPLLRAEKIAPTRAGGANKLLWSAEERLLGLLEAHPARWHDMHIYLAAYDDARDSVRVLHTGCELIETRRSLASFLALRDRGDVPIPPPLSDFMTYLRFHLGDALFGSYLVRVGAMLQALPKLGGFARASPFARALQGVQRPAGFCKRMAQVRDATWRKLASRRIAPKRAQMEETVWRHVGLLDHLRGLAGSPDWLPPAPAPDPLVLAAADAAREIVAALHEHDALPAIEAFLYRTPYSRLKILAGMNGLFPGRDGTAALAPLAKAHSYVRLRATFAEALASEEMAD